MADQIVVFIAKAVRDAGTLMVYVYEQTGMYPLVFAALSTVLIVRYVLGPIVGFSSTSPLHSLGSDTAKSKKKGSYTSKRKNMGSDTAKRKKEDK